MLFGLRTSSGGCVRSTVPDAPCKEYRSRRSMKSRSRIEYAGPNLNLAGSSDHAVVKGRPGVLNGMVKSTPESDNVSSRCLKRREPPRESFEKRRGSGAAPTVDSEVAYVM